MRLFHQPPAQSLSEWLDMATRDLVPSAQTRIRAEIEAHYNEAVQSGLANGSPENLAQSFALADLGNPKSAARRFRHQYLTKKDAMALAAQVKSCKNGAPLANLLCFVLSIYLICDLYSRNPDGLPYQLFLFGVLLVLATFIPAGIAAFILARRTITLRTRIQLTWLGFMLSLWLYAMSLLLALADFSWTNPHNAPTGDIFFGPLIVALFAFIDSAISLLRIFRLCKKILAAIESDFPPSGPTAA